MSWRVLKSCPARIRTPEAVWHALDVWKNRPGVINRRISEVISLFEENEVMFDPERHLQGRSCPDQHLVTADCSVEHNLSVTVRRVLSKQPALHPHHTDLHVACRHCGIVTVLPLIETASEQAPPASLSMVGIASSLPGFQPVAAEQARGTSPADATTATAAPAAAAAAAPVAPVASSLAVPTASATPIPARQPSLVKLASEPEPSRAAATAAVDLPSVFSGMTIHLVGFSEGDAARFRRMIVAFDGDYSPDSNGCTHVVLADGAKFMHGNYELKDRAWLEALLVQGAAAMQ
eukprot:m.105868 g.105868  ORF g.105868 m.105868 type:complete len:292 (-) comp14212_c1_seq1:25-900(-)